MERIRGGGVNRVQGLCVRWCFCGGSSRISAFTEQIKSLHEICLLAEHIKADVILDNTTQSEETVSNDT